MVGTAVAHCPVGTKALLPGHWGGPTAAAGVKQPMLCSLRHAWLFPTLAAVLELLLVLPIQRAGC